MSNIFGSTTPANVNGSAATPVGVWSKILATADGLATGVRIYTTPTMDSSPITIRVFGPYPAEPMLVDMEVTPNLSVGWHTYDFTTPFAVESGSLYRVLYGKGSGTLTYSYAIGTLPVSGGGLTYENSRVNASPSWLDLAGEGAINEFDNYYVDLEIGEASSLDVSVGPDQSVTSAQVADVEAIASGGAGAKTYAWTETSGPAGTFGSASSASTTFTPTGGVGTYVLRCTVTDSSGSDFDELTVTVTAPPTTATYSGSSPSAGWAEFGGSLPEVLRDGDDATGVRSTPSPASLVYDDTLTTLAVPAGDASLTLTLGIRRTGGSSGTAVARLYEGATLRSTSTSRTLPTAEDGALTIEFPAADLTAIAPESWTSGLRLTVTVTAS